MYSCFTRIISEEKSYRRCLKEDATFAGSKSEEGQYQIGLDGGDVTGDYSSSEYALQNPLRYVSWAYGTLHEMS